FNYDHIAPHVKSSKILPVALGDSTALLFEISDDLSGVSPFAKLTLSPVGSPTEISEAVGPLLRVTGDQYVFFLRSSLPREKEIYVQALQFCDIASNCELHEAAGDLAKSHYSHSHLPVLKIPALEKKETHAPQSYQLLTPRLHAGEPGKMRFHFPP